MYAESESHFLSRTCRDIRSPQGSNSHGCRGWQFVCPTSKLRHPALAQFKDRPGLQGTPTLVAGKIFFPHQTVFSRHQWRKHQIHFFAVNINGGIGLSRFCVYRHV